MEDEYDNPQSELDLLRQRVQQLETFMQIMEKNQITQIAGRLQDIEKTIGDKGDIESGDFPHAGTPPDVRVHPEPRIYTPQDFLSATEIEHGKPTANVTTDVATVTLQPCDSGGNSFASAPTVTLYIANDRQTQATANRGWTTSTILSFVRFQPWVSGTPNIEGVLIGEGLDPIPSGVVRGDVITGQGATPAWTRLALGSTDYVLVSDGTDVVWAAVPNTGKAKCDALDSYDYLEGQFDAPGENISISKVNLGGNEEVMRIVHDTVGNSAQSITLGDGAVIYFDANGHYYGFSPAP